MISRNVLITGGTGFIGSRLALKCIEKGFNVRIFGQENTDAEKTNRKLIESNGVEVIIGSISEKEQVSRSLKGIDVVFHLAAAQHEANVPDRVFWDVNVAGTKNLLDLCLKENVSRFVHGSTIGVYGRTNGAVDEESLCNPENIYGITKLEGEKVVLTYQDKIPLVIIRISETYGPGDMRLLKLFKMINKNRFFMIGNGKNLHQLIFIDDLVSGLLYAADSTKALNEIILLVGKEPINTDNMIKTIARNLDARLHGFRAPLLPLLAVARMMEAVLRPFGIQPPLHRRRMDFFRKSFSFSSQKASHLLSFKPKFSFKEGTAETVRWYKDQGFLENNTNHKQAGRFANIRVDLSLSAKIEPFDTFWEAPDEIEKGFEKFAKFYKRNYFKYMPKDKESRILVISCGAGYMVELMGKEGYKNVLGIDSDPDKIAIAKKRGLNCGFENAFSFLKNGHEKFDLIFVEQEINHLTKEEICIFFELCRFNLKDGGMFITHSLNGANPIIGSEALSQNFNHFNTFTEYSLRQVLQYTKYKDIVIFPLELFIFYENPFNYLCFTMNKIINFVFRLCFIFYGKENHIFSKKIAALAIK